MLLEPRKGCTMTADRKALLQKLSEVELALHEKAGALSRASDDYAALKKQQTELKEALRKLAGG